MVTFRLYADIRMSRPIDKEKDYICPGGYIMTMGGKSIMFDFEDTYGYILDEDPSVIRVECRNPDHYTYKDLDSVAEKMLEQVTEIREFFVYTGEYDETNLKPVELISCSFVLPDSDWKEIKIPEAVCKATELTCNID